MSGDAEEVVEVPSRAFFAPGLDAVMDDAPGLDVVMGGGSGVRLRVLVLSLHQRPRRLGWS